MSISPAVSFPQAANGNTLSFFSPVHPQVPEPLILWYIRKVSATQMK